MNRITSSDMATWMRPVGAKAVSFPQSASLRLELRHVVVAVLLHRVLSTAPPVPGHEVEDDRPGGRGQADGWDEETDPGPPLGMPGPKPADGVRDRRFELFLRPVVRDDDTPTRSPLDGPTDFGVHRDLTADPAVRVLNRQMTIPSHQPPDLLVLADRDGHDGAADELPHPADVEEERDVKDDAPVSGQVGSHDLLRHLLGHGRVGDLVQPSAPVSLLGGVAEDVSAERGPIDRPVAATAGTTAGATRFGRWEKKVLALGPERLDDLGVDGRARFLDLPDDLVGVDDGDVVWRLGQHPRRRRFPARDSAGEAEDEHVASGG